MRWNVALILGLVVVLSTASLSAQKRPHNEVSQSRLIKETQVQPGGHDCVDVVWWVPLEYWQVAFSQNKEMTREQREEFMDALRPYFLLGVVRAEVSPMGQFRFAGEEEVLQGLVATHVDARGKKHILKRPREINVQTQSVLGAIRPVLAAAMGPMGKSFHLYVYEDQDEKGRRMVSPYQKGKLVVELQKLGKLPASKAEFETPLDCLFVPRKCSQCKKEAHVSWNYCPWCGRKLPKLEAPDRPDSTATNPEPAKGLE
ncbi:MAG TPA: zinc ribbon domain-containing protein [Phycisphaerae bacterium]|nr:zinc ribbon domain-containing protein [Phycisphaerae bacterium]